MEVTESREEGQEPLMSNEQRCSPGEPESLRQRELEFRLGTGVYSRCMGKDKQSGTEGDKDSKANPCLDHDVESVCVHFCC